MTTGMGVAAPTASATVLAEPIHIPLRTEPGHGGTNAVCLVVGVANVSPGLSLTPSAGTADTGGETWKISCTGTFNGHRVTGPGALGFKGTYAGTCLAAHLSARISDTVPTDAGPMHFTGPLEESTIGLTGQFVAYQPGARLTGFGIFEPGRGDCVTKPVTKSVAQSTLFATDQRD